MNTITQKETAKELWNSLKPPSIRENERVKWEQFQRLKRDLGEGNKEHHKVLLNSVACSTGMRTVGEEMHDSLILVKILRHSQKSVHTSYVRLNFSKTYGFRWCSPNVVQPWLFFPGSFEKGGWRLSWSLLALFVWTMYFTFSLIPENLKYINKVFYMHGGIH